MNITVPHNLQAEIAGQLECVNDFMKAFTTTPSDHNLELVSIAMREYQKARRTVARYKHDERGRLMAQEDVAA